MRVHTYVIAIDAGSAPNYDPPCITLAVCKPRIRRKAAIGELILAFAGNQVNPTQPHSVVWAGIISEKMRLAEYWNDHRFAGKKPNRSARPDNFYRPVAGELLWVQNDVHGAEATNHDTSGEFVLAFSPSWRFGSHGPLMPSEFGLRMVNGRRGERVLNLPDPDLKQLKAWLDSHVSDDDRSPQQYKRCRPKTSSSKAPKPIRRNSKCQF